MEQYQELGRFILEHGVEKEDRTGTGTISIFGYMLRFRLQDGFPLVTTKSMYDPEAEHTRFDDIIEELLWFLSGDTNIRTLVLKGVNIWNRDAYGQYLRKNMGDVKAFNPHVEPIKQPLTYKEFVERIKYDEHFAREYGDMGRIYGKQWREWRTHNFNPIKPIYTSEGVGFPTRTFETIDQIMRVRESLRNNPDDRGHLVNTWNAGELSLMGLRPCHDSHQFYVGNHTLSCMVRQRSMDYFLGGPYNFASYATYTLMMAQDLGLAPGELIFAIGDAHIYKDHIDQVKEQLTRTPRPLPTLQLNPFKKDLFTFTREDFELQGYDPYPELKGRQSF